LAFKLALATLLASILSLTSVPDSVSVEVRSSLSAYGYWAALTAALVMESGAGASYLRGINRMGGTVIGAAAGKHFSCVWRKCKIINLIVLVADSGFLITLIMTSSDSATPSPRSPYVLAVLIFICLPPFLLLKRSTRTGYAGSVACFTLIMVALSAHWRQHAQTGSSLYLFVLARVLQIAYGVVICMLVAQLLWPNRARERLPLETADGLSQLHVLFATLLRHVREQASMERWLDHHHMLQRYQNRPGHAETAGSSMQSSSLIVTSDAADSNMMVESTYQNAQAAVQALDSLVATERAVLAHLVGLRATLDEALIEPRLPRAFASCPAYTTRLRPREWERFIECLRAMLRALRGMRKAVTMLMQVRVDQLQHLHLRHQRYHDHNTESAARVQGFAPNDPMVTPPPDDFTTAAVHLTVTTAPQLEMVTIKPSSTLPHPSQSMQSLSAAAELSSAEASRAPLLVSGNIGTPSVTVTKSVARIAPLIDPVNQVEAAGTASSGPSQQLPLHSSADSGATSAGHHAARVSLDQATAAPSLSPVFTHVVPAAAVVDNSHNASTSHQADTNSVAPISSAFHQLQHRVPTVTALDRIGLHCTFVTRVLVLHLHTTTTLPRAVLTREEEHIAEQVSLIWSLTGYWQSHEGLFVS